MKKPDPVINLKVLRRPKILSCVRDWLTQSKLEQELICPMPGETCVKCRKLFGDNRFDRSQSFHKCPCHYYGPRKTYLAVKKAVEEIEKEGL